MIIIFIFKIEINVWCYYFDFDDCYKNMKVYEDEYIYF